MRGSYEDLALDEAQKLIIYQDIPSDKFIDFFGKSQDEFEMIRVQLVT